MARLAVRVAAIHREPHIVRLKIAVPTHTQLPCTRRRRRRQERVSALGTKKVLFMIRPLPQRGVVQTDKPLLDNRSFTRIASGSEILVIVQMTVRPPLMLIRAHMLQKLITHRTPKTPRMPPRSHRIHNAPHNRPIAPPTNQPTPTLLRVHLRSASR